MDCTALPAGAHSKRTLVSDGARADRLTTYQSAYINQPRGTVLHLSSSLKTKRFRNLPKVKMSVEDVALFEGDHDHDDDTQGVVLAKGVSMAVLFCASMICGLAPLLLAKKFHWVSAEDAGNLKSTNRLVMTLLSFGGGVLLSTTFMHLMPEVDHNVLYLQREYKKI